MKTYLLMRRDLHMRRGKEIAQACHAVIGLGLMDAPTITLKCDSLPRLNQAVVRARAHGWPCHVVADAGHTEIEPGTVTCAAIRAPEGVFMDFDLY